MLHVTVDMTDGITIPVELVAPPDVNSNETLQNFVQTFAKQIGDLNPTVLTFGTQLFYTAKILAIKFELVDNS